MTARAPTRTAARIARSGPRALHVPGAFGVVVDTREQKPLTFNPAIPLEVRKLDAGDYSVIGYESQIAIERKSADDFARSVTVERARFWDELARLATYDAALVLVEADMRSLAAGDFASHGTVRIEAADVEKAVTQIMIVHRVPVLLCSDRTMAARCAVRFLKFWWARRRDAERAERFALVPSGTEST